MILKCPNCRRRYDPGLEDELDDLPEDHGMLVVCPACGQWLSLPDKEPVDTPDIPKHVRRQMTKQSRLVDEDDEDDRPTRRRRPRDEEDDEDNNRPVRSRSRRKPGVNTTLLVVGGVVATLLLLVCCGGGIGYWYFSRTTVEITSATRQTDPLGNTTVRVTYRVKAAAPAGQSYVLVTSAGGQTVTSPVIISSQVGTGSAGWGTPAFRNAGTIDVWVEQQAPGSQTGKKVSRTVTAR